MTRALRASVAAATGLAIAFGPVIATAVADPAAAAETTFDRSLSLQGVQNARDAGGYRTTDGRWVRTGLVYRTGQLNNATPADLATLSGHGIRVVDDLRTVYERTIAPDRVPAGAVQNWDDVIGQAPPQTLATTLTGGDDLYRAFITAPGANQAFAEGADITALKAKMLA
ncbi:tyrosine-protein phosphatase [Nocardia sp. NPDC050710]|uniref:tyrosine-protein phosphatase n=1 Tax=Nocardia sp. NPDC050710 TaxID=3157220 RepID=UPI0033F71A7C